MKKIHDFKEKKILVLGLGKSGTSAAKLLKKLGADVQVNDAAETLALGLEEMGITVITGSHPLELLDGVELLVKNPGIPYENIMVTEAIKRQIPVWTDIELAYRVSEAEIIAITGTNGKTTTTSLIEEMFKQANKPAKVAGNIGIPASQVAEKVSSQETIIMESSSFQLMGTEKFHPKIAIITNIFSAHLDYHGSQEAYEVAKWKIQNNMIEDDFLILNLDQEKMLSYVSQTRANVQVISLKKKTNAAYLLEGKIYYQEEYIMEADQLSLPGDHNLENALFALTAAKLSGIENQAICKALTTFTGKKHRLQFLGKAQGRMAYNDTEATNILATQKALTGFDHKKVWLFIGGLDRGNSFDELSDSLVDLKGMIIMGESSPKLVKLAESLQIPYHLTENVKTGLLEIFPQTEKGDILLLSPACASWDQYKNAAERGDLFIETFENLKLDSEKEMA
ncbi:MAG: UDP-N-acetylmuramoyl-L-alanine--D-glutamate ligase [Lactovum sp.]